MLALGLALLVTAQIATGTEAAATETNEPAASASPPTSTTGDSAATNITLHPALFLVGDSIVKTGSGNGEKGP